MVSFICGLLPFYNFKIPSLLLLLDPPGKPDHQAIHCPTANFEPLSRSNAINPILVTVFDTYLTPRSLGAWVFESRPFRF